MRTPVLAATLFALCGGAALPQSPTPKPQPGPEHQRLAYMIGNWSLEAEMKPGAKTTATETCEWYPGKFAMVCHSDTRLPTGDIKALGIMTYDSGEKRYLYFETSNTGENVVAKGTVDGPTWTWLSESQMGGKLWRNRFTFTEAPPDAATYKFEMAEGDGPWTEIMHGKQTRVK